MIEADTSEVVWLRLLDGDIDWLEDVDCVADDDVLAV